MFRYTLWLWVVATIFLSAVRVRARESERSDRWHKIETDVVSLFYPAGLEPQAQRMAHVLHCFRQPLAHSLGSVPPKCTMVLRNDLVESNAYFAPYPFHTRFSVFSTPDYCFTGTADWLHLTLLHEIRHSMQHERLYGQPYNWQWWLCTPTWINRPPDWWFEGDAVCTETLLTSSGRGRLPHFLRLYKANLMSGKRFSYAKQTLGSFRDAVGSHYPMGYLMMTHLRRRYGADKVAQVWTSTMNQLCFYRAFKKAIGKHVSEVYKDMNEELYTLWSQQLEDIHTTPADSVDARDMEEYVDYLYPHDLGNGKTLALKEGMGTTRRFVGIDAQGNEEVVLHIRGENQPTTSFSASRDAIVWLERVPAVLGRRFYHRLQRYDMDTRKIRTLNRACRYAAVALSPDASRMVACAQDPNYNHRLVLLDAHTGEHIHTFDNPDDAVYRDPSWSADGEHILAVKYKAGRAALVRIHSLEGKEQILLAPADHHPMGAPAEAGKYVLYSSPCKGIDNLYAVDTDTGVQYQVTLRKYGAYNPYMAKNGQEILFNDFDAGGMGIKKMAFDPAAWIPIEEAKDVTISYYEPLLKEEIKPERTSASPREPYSVVRPRSGWWMLERGWQPMLGVDVRQGEMHASIDSGDVMDWTHFKVSYEDSGLFCPGTQAVNVELRYHKDYLRWSGLAHICLQGTPPTFVLACGLPMHHPTFSSYKSEQLVRMSLQEYESRALFYISEASAQQYRALSDRDIYSASWQRVGFVFKHPMYTFATKRGAFYRLEKYRAALNMGFPGLGKHHALSCFALWKHETLVPKLKNASDQDTFTLAVQYDLPLAYPDWSRGMLFYLKRFRISSAYLFEYALPSSPHLASSYRQEYQTQLSADWHGMALPEQITCGLEHVVDLCRLKHKTGPFFKLNFLRPLPERPRFKHAFSSVRS